ncbi:MAG: MerR family transcriptional regulator [Planctomycetota bacterium]
MNKEKNLKTATTGYRVIKKILEHKLFENNNIFYKVNELSKLTGLSRQQIHLYTQMGLIKESYRSQAGHRFYSKDTVDRIFLIEMLKRHRTLSEIKELLKNKDVS